MAFKRRRRRFRRKSTKKGRRMRVARRVPRPMRSNVLFTKFRLVEGFEAAASSKMYQDLGFNITQFPTSVQNLFTYFERFRIHLVVLKIIPSFNTIGRSALDGDTFIGDQFLLRTPSTSFTTVPTYSIKEIAACDKVKIRRGTQIVTAKCVPNIVSYNAVTATGAPVPGIGSVIYKPWISEGGQKQNFFTWQWFRNSGGGSYPCNYTFYTTIYCEFRDRVVPAFNP
nr:MAG: capsid protein [Cressdnaviricota sp.]